MYFFYNDYKVNYYISGTKDWLVLLHGWKMSQDTYIGVTNKLSKHYKVLSIDLLGFGESDLPNEPLFISDYLDMLEKLLNHLGIENPTLLGHSFGGKLATYYALKHKVKKLILVSPSGIKHFNLKVFLKIRLYKFIKFIYKILGIDITKLQNKYGSNDYKNLSPVMKKTMTNILKGNVKKELKKITSPTLMLWGYYDKITPYKDSNIYLKKIKNSKLVTFQRSGHFCYLDEPEKFIYTIISEEKL